MTRTALNLPGSAEQTPPIYFSLVLRWWLTPAGSLNGYVLEIPSGIRHAFGDADSLFQILRQTFAACRVDESAPDSDF